LYVVIPMLIALALMLSASAPSDPGGRIAAANRADGLAAIALEFHQAAVAYIRANPATAGALPALTLPTGWTASGLAACASSKVVATYVTVPPEISAPAVASSMSRQWGGWPLVGQASGNTLVSPYGASVTLPCPVPNGAPVIVSQAGS